MTRYKVNQLSKLAGVSVRTLHHYDRIGLLKPALRSEKGYRYYEKRELYRLQQILFYKELDFSLKEIKAILDDPDFDLIGALEFHKTALSKRNQKLQRLLITIDKTISELKNQTNMLSDKELYEGFSPEQVKSMREEVKERWGEEELLSTETRIKKMGQEAWKETKDQGAQINQLLAELMDHSPNELPVQEAIAQHHVYMNTFYEVNEERYRGLADMYVEDERFRVYYEKYREGLATFIRNAIHVYCDNGMKVIS